MRASQKTPVEQTVDMLLLGMELPTICLCLKVSTHHGRQLVRLAKRQLPNRYERAA